jgi:hypothetical protein
MGELRDCLATASPLQARYGSTAGSNPEGRLSEAWGSVHVEERNCIIQRVCSKKQVKFAFSENDPKSRSALETIEVL